MPAELGNLANLKHLGLSRNELTGSIPAELGNLVNLESLILWTNELTGPIPAELGSLLNLTDLSLSRNALTGPLPAELGSLESLERMWIRETDLSGPIPGTFVNLSLSLFHWFETDLCAPTDERFQAWLDSIEDHNGGEDCASGSSGSILRSMMQPRPEAGRNERYD